MSTNRISLVLAMIALAVSIGSCASRNRVEYPGVSHIRLRDSDTGEPVGFVHAEYGAVTIACYSEKNPRRTELKLSRDTVTIELRDGGKVVGTWTLPENGDNFEKHEAGK